MTFDIGTRAAGMVLLVLVGPAPASADCFVARDALMSARYVADGALQDEATASERYIVAHSEAEAARLRLRRDEERERSASRDRSERISLCRYLHDDRDRTRACEDQANAT